MGKIKVISQALSKCINLHSLFLTDEKLFDLSKLGKDDIVTLLDADPIYFSKKVPNLCEKDKAYIFSKLTPEDRKLSGITLSKEELIRATPEIQRCLSYESVEFLTVEFFNRLSSYEKNEMSLRYPEWAMGNPDVCKLKFSANNLLTLAKSNPKFIDDTIKDFSKVSTCCRFWKCMFKYDKKYLGIFIKNTKSLITKTDVREIIRSYPEIIKLIDQEVLDNSKLSIKELLLLSTGIISSHPKIFSNWDFSPDLKESFRLGVMVELLNGKSKNTSHLKGAVKVLTAEDEI